MSYFANGNIASKSDTGDYAYGQAQAGCSSSTAGPHALTAVVPNAAGSGGATGTKNATYCYDANGNMTSGDGRLVTYSAFDKPIQITKGASQVNFFYGPSRARYKRFEITAAASTTTIYAAGGSYERIDRNGIITEKHFVGGFTVVTDTYTTGTPTRTIAYLHHDHLGSTDTTTDESGAITQQMSFDAWGKRREVNWQPMATAAAMIFDTTITTRGFTGHEMVDSVGLVHMNGRVYDPELGRFLSADPHVQDATNLQSWNRYAYVLNNPLSYTDPTGFFFKKLFRAIGRVLLGGFIALKSVAKKVLSNPLVRAAIQIIACAPGPWVIATCGAAVAGMTLATGGSIGQALKATAFAFATMGAFRVVGIGLRAAGVLAQNLGTIATAAIKGAVHGVVGGAIAAARGGSFAEGFVANAIGAAAGVFADGIAGGDMALHTAIVAGAGCAGAMLSGGKCGNGAVTAAFANMYNHFKGRQSGRRGKRLKKGGKPGLFGALDEFIKRNPGAVLKVGGWHAASFEGKRIWVNDSIICILCTNKKGVTSLELMISGRAPIGTDNRSMHLHHIGQTNNSPLAEIRALSHLVFSRALHNSWPRGTRSMVNRGSPWRSFKKRYWKARARDF